MDFDIIVKSATLLIGAIGSGKLLYDLSVGKGGRMREEYKFAKDFIDQIKSDPKLHPFLREKGYQAIAGDRELCGDEIEYLLSLKRPDRALRDYVLGRPYLEHLPNAGNLQINFKKRYKGSWSRWWRKSLYFVLYFILFFAAFSPLLFSRMFTTGPTEIFVAFAFSIAVFGSYAWFALKAATRIVRAEKLVKNQDKHTIIITPK